MQQAIKGEDATLAVIVCAQHKQRVLDRNDDRDGPDRERYGAEDIFRCSANVSRAEEYLIDSIQRRGADVSENDAQRADGERWRIPAGCMAWYPFSASVSVRLALASASIVHSRGDSYF
jgi:hypothetical protein